MYVGNKNGIVNIKCPYFQTEFKRTLTCEGVDSLVTTKINTEDEKDSFIVKNCMRYPSDCPLATGLDVLYDADLFERT